jgi:drug/metabolite transporter (DMT)-like permease
MSLAWPGLLLAVLSSLSWSGLDLLRKLLVGKVSSLALLFWLTAGVLPLFALWAVIDGRFELAPGYWPPALASAVLNLVANLCFFEAMKRAPFSATIPLLSFTPAIATLLAIPVVGEVPPPMSWLGIGSVVLGALLLHWSPGSARVAPEQRMGLWLMLTTAVLWAATIALDKRAIERASQPVHGVVLLSVVAVFSLAVLLARGQARELAAVRQAPGTLVAALLVSGLALGTQLAALGLVSVSLVETLKRGVGNILAVPIGALLFGERVTAPKVVAVILMAVGAALVMLVPS